MFKKLIGGSLAAGALAIALVAPVSAANRAGDSLVNVQISDVTVALPISNERAMQESVRRHPPQPWCQAVQTAFNNTGSHRRDLNGLVSTAERSSDPDRANR